LKDLCGGWKCSVKNGNIHVLLNNGSQGYDITDPWGFIHNFQPIVGVIQIKNFFNLWQISISHKLSRPWRQSGRAPLKHFDRLIL
jgi:hypothetical protein